VTGMADPLDASYVARPDWPFLFLFQLLKMLPGQLEAFGTVGVPVIGILLLVSVPWLDRGPERAPAKRMVSVAVFVVATLALVALSIAGAQSGAPAAAAPTGPPGPTPDSSIVSTPPGPGPSIASHQIGGADHGAELFVLYCQECHGARGVTGVDNPGSADGTVPSLDPIDPAIVGKSRQEFVNGLDDFLQNGSVPSATTSTPNASPRLKMPSFGNTYALSQPQIADLEAYVMKVNGVDRAAIERPGVAPKTYFWVSLVGLAVAIALSGAAIIRSPRSA
jgi:mono/diheme cytochrome c family protein